MTRQQTIDFCLSLLWTYEDYPFGDLWTVMRHKGNTKSFALIYERDDKLYVNLKCDPMKADILRRSFDEVTPGYHMNKEHWNTVYLGGNLAEDEIFDMIEHSYNITKPKPKKKSEKQC